MALEVARRSGESMVDLIFHLWAEVRADIPALILAYSTIDAFASLARNDPEESTSADFKAWVGTYLVPGSELEGRVTPDELWAARCGLLHTFGPEARDVRKKGVRRVIYLT